MHWMLLLLLASAFIVTSSSLAMHGSSCASMQHRRWLVLDFDGTCTEKDTTPLLPKLASLCAGDSETLRKERLEKFHALEQEYFQAYQLAKDAVFKSDMDLEDAMNALDEVSTYVTHKVSACKCLAGLPHNDPAQIAELMDHHDEVRELTRLWPGCVSAVANAHCAGWELGVLSINWCPTLIDAALLWPVRHHLRTVGGASESPPSFAQTKIWSNTVDAKGSVTLNVPGALAKKAQIADLRSQSRPSFVVYIGDSSTDLLGMLEADVGVMIGDSRSTAKIAKQWRVRLAPLSERRGPSLMDEDTVWMAKGWDDIERLLEDLTHNFSQHQL